MYTYDASGSKLNKTVTEGSKTTTTEYIGGFQYEQNKLQFFPHAEGYVNVLGNLLNDNKTFHYVYNYADHLGNVRVSYAWDERGKLEILEENHYYPFGLKHRGYTDLVQVPVEIGVGVGVEPGGIGVISTDYSGSRSYNYKYNGKELEDDLGLDWYAMDMRMYDPTIARWMVHDPVVHHNMSPYNAFDNNPVYWADPSGADSQGGGDESNIGDTKIAFGVTLGQLGQVSKIEYWSASGDTSSGNGNNSKKNDNKGGSNNKKGSNTSSTENDIPPFEGFVELEEIVITALSQLESKLEEATSFLWEGSLDKFVNSNFVKGSTITGSLISESGRQLQKAVEKREGIYLTDGKSKLQKGKLSIRELNGTTYRNIKLISRGLTVVGYGVTVATIYNDFNNGNVYTGMTRLAVNGIIVGVSVACPVCGLGLSIAEATMGNYLYNYVENNFDK
ncbi:RHS repeat domain-containing protein [Vaginella massiliensis]|uniref:RHS repeat domain-containing protein n=1 Tax=Vaginella massiliensis TaxID=1816680 RepID=UPI0008398852|nr:RHS repeat-associated core domain-containing protein [Vaginella massiliensis]